MTTITETKACAKCTYWQSSDSAKGQCRRHAPMTVVFKVDEKTTFASRFPETKAEDWCGDFSLK